MRLLRRCLVLIALPVGALGGAAADRAAAQPSDYPNRAVTFIVPFAPGGVTSLFARILGQKLEQRLGKPFVVENRPGGGGVTAATAVQLTPIALLARVPFVLVVNPALPIHSVADLVKLAREKPGEIAFGTPGPGTFHHLNAEMFKGIFGLNLVHVPYKGSAPALNDLVGGHIQMMFCDVPPARSLIEAGKIRALGVTTKERVPAVTEIPPLAQAGIPGYDTASWHTVTTTGNVPKPIVDTLYGNIREIMSDPSVTDTLVKDGTIPQVSPPPDEMKRFVASEITRWGKVVEQAGLAGSE